MRSFKVLLAEARAPRSARPHTRGPEGYRPLPGMDTIRQKSVAQSDYLLGLVRLEFADLGIRVGSPAHAKSRGSHVSLKHKEAYRICKAFADPGVGDGVVIPDFREPDNIRLGITPLYTSYEEIFRAIMQLKEIISDGLYENYPRTRDRVT